MSSRYVNVCGLITDFVSVSPPALSLDDIARDDQVAQDALDPTFRQIHAQRHIAKPRFGVSRDADQHLSVFGEKAPRRGHRSGGICGKFITGHQFLVYCEFAAPESPAAQFTTLHKEPPCLYEIDQFAHLRRQSPFDPLRSQVPPRIPHRADLAAVISSPTRSGRRRRRRRTTRRFEPLMSPLLSSGARWQPHHRDRNLRWYP